MKKYWKHILAATLFVALVVFIIWWWRREKKNTEATNQLPADSSSGGSGTTPAPIPSGGGSSSGSGAGSAPVKVKMVYPKNKGQEIFLVDATLSKLVLKYKPTGAIGRYIATTSDGKYFEVKYNQSKPAAFVLKDVVKIVEENA
jgi:hypothetical protein